MGSLPKPLIGLLLGTVAFFAIWMVALKPSSSSSGASSQGGAGQYQSAINQAHGAATTSGQANAKLGAPTATAAAPKPATPAKAAPAAPAAKAARVAKTKASASPAAKSARSTASDQSSAAAGVQTVQNAIGAGKVVAVLFYNGAASDDQAMKKELATVATHGGKVVTLAVPVAQLTDYGVITQQVPVVTAPTLVVIDAAHHASTITGYADPIELAQRIADAVAAK